MKPLGKRQIETLAEFGPHHAPVVVAREHLSLIKRGLVADVRLVDTACKGSFPHLTPNGLRTLADLIEAGAVESLGQHFYKKYAPKRRGLTT